jgi:hypothetical protein
MDCGNVLGSLLGESNNNHQSVIALCKISEWRCVLLDCFLAHWTPVLDVLR